MLTKTDLSQIRKVVREEILPVDKKVGKIQKMVEKTANFLDREHLGLVKRVEKIEDHFNLPKPLF